MQKRRAHGYAIPQGFAKVRGEGQFRTKMEKELTHEVEADRGCNFTEMALAGSTVARIAARVGSDCCATLKCHSNVCKVEMEPQLLTPNS
jgi:hypothetical protein